MSGDGFAEMNLGLQKNGVVREVMRLKGEKNKLKLRRIDTREDSYNGPHKKNSKNDKFVIIFFLKYVSFKKKKKEMSLFFIYLETIIYVLTLKGRFFYYLCVREREREAEITQLQ